VRVARPPVLRNGGLALCRIAPRLLIRVTSLATSPTGSTAVIPALAATSALASVSTAPASSTLASSPATTAIPASLATVAAAAALAAATTAAANATAAAAAVSGATTAQSAEPAADARLVLRRLPPEGLRSRPERHRLPKRRSQRSRGRRRL